MSTSVTRLRPKVERVHPCPVLHPATKFHGHRFGGGLCAVVLYRQTNCPEIMTSFLEPKKTPNKYDPKVKNEPACNYGVRERSIQQFGWNCCAWTQTGDYEPRPQTNPESSIWAKREHALRLVYLCNTVRTWGSSTRRTWAEKTT